MISASADYPGYNPNVCWAGYIDVVKRFPACDYYDAVTSGILWKIRKHHDKPSFEFSMKVIEKHQSEFMFWGVKYRDYSYEENKQSTATISWLSLLYLNTRAWSPLGISIKACMLFSMISLRRVFLPPVP
jgi:hypothetical protein